MPYTEPGATATDPQSGDLTSDIVTTYKKLVDGVAIEVSHVDTYNLGGYHTVYSVIDPGGLSATATRVLNIVPLLNTVASSTEFLFNNHVQVTMLDKITGDPISDTYDPAKFELRYKETGEVIASGVDVFVFNVPDLAAKDYIFTVDKGETTEQTFEFTITHYPDDKYYVGTLGSVGISYRIIEALVYKNDIANSDIVEDTVNWGDIEKGMIIFNYLIGEGGSVDIYDDGVLVHTLHDPVVGLEYSIPTLTTENIAIEYNLVHYGHVQNKRTPIDIKPYKNVLNTHQVGVLGNLGTTDHSVLNQTLDQQEYPEPLMVGVLGSLGTTNHMVLNQTLEKHFNEDNLGCSHISNIGISDYYTLLQSNTEVS